MPTTVTELFIDSDNALFSRILANSDHVLQPYLPDRRSMQYNLRAKTHNKELIVKTPHLTDRDYIVRMLYKNIYWRLLHLISTFFTNFNIIHFYCELVASDNFLQTNITMMITLRSVTGIAIPSVVCNVGASYSEGWIFRKIFAPYCSPSIRLGAKKTTQIYFFATRFSRGCYVQSGISRYILLYLANDTRYGPIYSGRRIGTRIRSIKWCYFQWPWMTPNTDFKDKQLC